MHPMAKRAHEAMTTPEVQDMVRRLAAYGLAVYMPHYHDPETGEFRSLPTGTVQLEANLRVSFEEDSNELRSTSTAVAWVWDDGLETVAACSYCMDTQKGHARYPD